MSGLKFDECDRQKVISAIENHFGVTLAPISGRRKFLEDRSGKIYWLLGGYEDWHGIPKEMFLLENKRKADGLLVIAKRYKSKIDIYTGKLNILIESERRLSHTKTGDLQFNITIRNNHMYINEVYGYFLHKIDSIVFSDEENKKAKNSSSAIKIIRRLSHDKRQALLEKLLQKNENQLLDN
jgi:hypothetical protein